MNQQQMTREMIEFDNSLPNNTFSAINTIWDQSAKIFAAVIDNVNLLPDDGRNEPDNRIPAYKTNHGKTPGLSNEERSQLTILRHARLQEEHALWLK